MFGDMMGNLEEQQAQMKEKLSAIELSAEAGDGAVTIKGTAAREITSIKFDTDKLDWSDQEMVEDLIIVAMNDLLEDISSVEAEESQKMINDMLPGLGGMFGG